MHEMYEMYYWSGLLSFLYTFGLSTKTQHLKVNIKNIEWPIHLLNLTGGSYIVGTGWIFYASFKFWPI